MVKLFRMYSNLCDHNPLTLQTDGQTDRQTTSDRNTALCTKVHRAVKSTMLRYRCWGIKLSLVHFETLTHQYSAFIGPQSVHILCLFVNLLRLFESLNLYLKSPAGPSIDRQCLVYNLRCRTAVTFSYVSVSGIGSAVNPMLVVIAIV